MTMHLPELSAWLAQYRAAAIPVARIEVSRDLAWAAYQDAFDRWGAALHLPWSGYISSLAKEQMEAWRAVLGGRTDLAGYVFGVQITLGSDNQDAGFVIVPVRDRLIFGASA